MSDSIPTELVIRGKRVAQDGYGFLSLTDMWRLAGDSNAKRPAHWQKLPTTLGLIEALHSNVGFSYIWANTPGNSAIYSVKGRQGGTFAHVILGLAYAEYLDPQLGIEVREIALRFWAGDLTLLDEFTQRREDQAAEDGNRILARERIREDNSKLQFGVLRSLGARNRAQYAEFHNSGYRGLYNGEDENAIHRRKELEPEQSILDHMTFAELSANMFRVSQTEGRLRKLPVDNLEEANRTHMYVAMRIREFMAEMGNDMPEDMPTADSITDAKKRLRDYGKGQRKVK